MSQSVLGVDLAPGLHISGVLYRYTTVKDPNDPLLVNVQNERANGPGYIFRETDDWSGLPGNTINKYVPVELSPIGEWGRGSITTEGQGDVKDPSVIYTYRLDECFNPQSSPSCPGYKDLQDPQIQPVNYDLYNALDDDAVRSAMSPTDPELYEEEEEDEDMENAEEEVTEDDFERGLAAAQNALTLASGVSQEMVIGAMNANVNIASYYSVTMSGGVYQESINLPDSQLPENERGLRNGLAQQLLHERMVEQQYIKLSF